MQNKTIGRKGQLLAHREKKEFPYALSDSEQKRKQIAERMDKKSLLKSAGKAVEDQDDRLLVPPASVERVLNDKLVVAQSAPRIDFAVIPYNYRYFPEMTGDRKIGPWSSWGQSGYHPAEDKFFGAVGDHGWYNSNLHVVEYDCSQRSAKCLPEINTLLERKPEEFGEAKIHGYPDVYKASYLKNDHLWFCTYWCRYPEPLEHDFASGYTGGHIMSYDLKDGSFVDYGVPLVRASWPYHRVDRRNGILYGNGMFGEFLAWDINRQELKWAGYLPPGMKWFNRCLMIDEESGMVYSNNATEGSRKIIKYDPLKNRFSELSIEMPLNRQYNKTVSMRCHARTRSKDGKFWGLTSLGDLFCFDPVAENLEIKERLWPLNDAYSVTMDQSPGGRYLYFGIGSHGRGYPYGTPILQHDLHTHTTKILAFLHPYYFEKYGYIAGGSYSFKLDDKGEKLFMIMNGDFTELEDLERKYREYDPDETKNWSVPSPHDAFGHCATFVIHIPEGERAE
ncbi:MAG TPA: hypothetical protein VMX75_16000 [Spirochaetia bacterium]|nr:hypothetical protein [Spirochaetia bacterium]